MKQYFIILPKTSLSNSLSLEIKSRGKYPAVVNYDALKWKVKENAIISSGKLSEDFWLLKDTICRELHMLKKTTNNILLPHTTIIEEFWS